MNNSLRYLRVDWEFSIPGSESQDILSLRGYVAKEIKILKSLTTNNAVPSTAAETEIKVSHV